MAHILIVEDDHAINELIARNLKLVRHSNKQVFDGMEAVRIANERLSGDSSGRRAGNRRSRKSGASSHRYR